MAVIPQPQKQLQFYSQQRHQQQNYITVNNTTVTTTNNFISGGEIPFSPTMSPPKNTLNNSSTNAFLPSVSDISYPSFPSAITHQPSSSSHLILASSGTSTSSTTSSPLNTTTNTANNTSNSSSSSSSCSSFTSSTATTTTANTTTSGGMDSSGGNASGVGIPLVLPDPFLELDSEAQGIVCSVAEMGFPIDRVARAVQRLGIQHKKVNWGRTKL